MMNFDEIEDTFHLEKFTNKTKKKNGCRKGKRVERDLVKVLNEKFNGGFSRSVGSGNRWSQVKNLPQHAKETLTGDLCAPEGFRFVCESKGGYTNLDLDSALDGGIKALDDFIEQVESDSKRCGKAPLLFWKRDRKPWLVFCKTAIIEGSYKYSLIYRDYTCVPLKELLKLPNEFFYTKSDSIKV
jgi:Holliday junction resolvase